MNQNIVQNTKTEVPETPKMNDRDYMSDLLEQEKNMSNNISIAIDEASNDSLYESYMNLFKDTKNMARDLYNVMFEKGWYSLEKADELKITQTKNKNEQKLSQLDKTT